MTVENRTRLIDAVAFIYKFDLCYEKGDIMLIKLEQCRPDVKELESGIAQLRVSVGADALKEEVDGLEAKTNSADFWSNPDEAQKILRVLKSKKNVLDSFLDLEGRFVDFLELFDMTIEEDDESMVEDLMADLSLIRKQYEEEKIKILLSGEYDNSNCIISIHPGAGGTEAQDWAQMLYRMYTRYAERKSFKVKVLDYLDGDEAGIKSVTLLVEGDNAYGYLKGENGVHRLVRVSPFDASGRRHTSFASVEVMPEFNDDMTIEIKDEDIKVDHHRSSGAGGQHVNKTDSAVRITHLPTGIVVNCQTERSQVQNKETAMKMLKSKLLEIKEREQLDKIDDIKGVKLNIEWGSQIRSYVFMPYTLVKDNRTNCETGNITAVMDGEIDGFISEYLKMKCQK